MNAIWIAKRLQSTVQVLVGVSVLAMKYSIQILGGRITLPRVVLRLGILSYYASCVSQKN